MKPIYTNENGDLLSDSKHIATALRGSEVLPAEDFIPMPKGATFAAMPGRVPLVMDKNGNVTRGRGTAVAVLLPQGFTRTMVPATETLAAGDTLASVAQKHNLPMAALLRANPCLAPGDFRAGACIFVPED